MLLQSRSAWRELETWGGTIGRVPWRLACLASLCVFIGCATAYTPPALTTQHPAHPEAPTAPKLLSSSTLAYGPADLPTPQAAFSLAQREMSHGAHGSASTHSPSVVGEGKVIAVMPEKSQIVVDHKDIPGVMGAMTMGYTVTPSSLLAPLKAGDAIRFTLDTQTQTIINIEKLHE
jgi:Cu/Ag efflux protein CusF